MKGSSVIRLLFVIAIIIGIIYLLSQLGFFSKAPKVIPPGTIDTIRNVNKAGDSVVSLKGTEKTFSLISKRIADSIADVYDTKVKNLKEVIIAQTRTIAYLQSTGPVEIDFMPPDTSQNKDCPPAIKNMRQTFTNPHYTARVQIGDSSYLHLEGRDTITGVWKQVKEGKLFNRHKYLQLDLSFADTSRHVTGLLAYRVPDKKPKTLGIGLSAGITWDGKFRPYAGVGLNWSFIRF